MRNPNDRRTLTVALPPKARLSYKNQLADIRWKRRRDELLRASNYTCCECEEPLVEGTHDLQVHHVFYVSSLMLWDYPEELLVVVCEEHHKERQAIEQTILMEVAKHLATRNIFELRQQPIYAFCEGDSTLQYLPAWQRDYLRYVNAQEVL